MTARTHVTMNSRVMKLLIRVMKLLIIFQIISFIFFCLAPLQLPSGPQKVQKYALSSDFSLAEATVVERAIEHFEKEIPCVKFVSVTDTVPPEKIKKIQILDFNPIDVFDEETKKKHKKNVVGMYYPDSHSIDISRKSVTVDKKTGIKVTTTLGDDYRFKITLHEIAHAFGMSGHPHPMESNGRTHLASGISYKSSKYLCKEDILYLRKLICNK